jgi:RNA polymerase sigma-70 factor (ECF subfamily)
LVGESELVAAFRAAWPHGGDPSSAELEAALEQALARAIEAWPGVALSPSRFAAALAERVDPQDSPADALASLHTSDLYLACACAEGRHEAIATLERSHLQALRPAIAGLGAGAGVIDDVLARVRARLLTDAGSGMAIAQYRGHGELAGWLKVIAIREALAFMRSDRHVPADDDEIEELLAPGDDPEVELMRERYSDAFRRAFQAALGELDSKDRNILRFHLVDRLGIDQLGAIHGVHRSTAARWLATIRERLYRSTRRHLMDALHIGTSELDSILRAIRSRLDASIGRHLDP